MINGKEVGVIILATLIMAFSNSFLDADLFLISIIFSFIVISVYVIIKKFVAYHVESTTEERIWHFERYGFREHQHLRTKIPLGIILPVILSFVTLGYIKWFGVTETDIKPAKARVAKRHDFYSYSELTEWHIGLIPAGGIAALMILAFFSYIVNLTELARLAIYFSFFNILPLGNLDGTKIFFGSKTLYFSLLAVVLIAVSYALMLV